MYAWRCFFFFFSPPAWWVSYSHVCASGVRSEKKNTVTSEQNKLNCFFTAVIVCFGCNCARMVCELARCTTVPLHTEKPGING